MRYAVLKFMDAIGYRLPVVSGYFAVRAAKRAAVLGDWESAATHYAAAVKSLPGRAKIWVQYGHALKETGAGAAAEAAYSRALELSGPAVADIYLQLGHVVKQLGRPAEALEHYRNAVDIDPTRHEAAVELGNLSAEIRHWQRSSPPMAVARKDVVMAHRLMLGSEPVQDTSFDLQMQLPSRLALIRYILESPQFESVHGSYLKDQLYTGYTHDELALFKEFRRYSGDGTPGFITNFLGNKVRTTFGARLKTLDGRVLDYPMPVGGLGGETAEFIGAMRSVLNADQQYTMLECGAGYGTWMVMTAEMAKQRGIHKLKLYGIEGDVGHFNFMLEHFNDNGIDPAACSLIYGAIGSEAGVAKWAVVDDSSKVYGGRPMDNSLIDYHGKTQAKYVEVKVYSLKELLAREPRWDLVHIDIQGGEGDLCRLSIGALNERVRRVCVGTHSRALDGEVMSVFHVAGWILENEKPTIMVWRDHAATLESMARVDGVQVWRNPRLDPLRKTPSAQRIAG